MAQAQVSAQQLTSQHTEFPAVSTGGANISSNEYTPFNSERESEYDFHVGVSADRNHRCRRTMEDAHCYFHDFGGIKDQGFFAIYDGHAGKAAAEYCGNNLHKLFNEILKNNPGINITEAFNEAFLLADDYLTQEKMNSGCTAVASFIRWEPETDSSKPRQRVLYTANAGDARAVLCRNGKALRLTYDHKGSDSQESKRILTAGGFMMNNRVNGVLAVTRALGDSSMKDFIIGNPYTTQIDLTKEDSFLILACDGLWDVCSDQDAVNLIQDIEDPQEASKKLLEFALNNFSTDNLSTMVVRLSH
ncbi:mgpp2cl-1, protein phosphatase 2C-like protein 1 [Entomophthora muscae]|uniref:Mgpp2cl-1, protein phosphatase 2C-like protein 1 n=1 Tax=Entomophthora muscae TaxID=34485 RepID=A0ACC2S6R5_9FUNG|nr:mgpp2cl-1, protein phosphatase 2C-like protein 1 [Entomophthora muscae]